MKLLSRLLLIVLFFSLGKCENNKELNLTLLDSDYYLWIDDYIESKKNKSQSEEDEEHSLTPKEIEYINTPLTVDEYYSLLKGKYTVTKYDTESGLTMGVLKKRIVLQMDKFNQCKSGIYFDEDRNEYYYAVTTETNYDKKEINSIINSDKETRSIESENFEEYGREKLLYVSSITPLKRVYYDVSNDLVFLKTLNKINTKQYHLELITTNDYLYKNKYKDRIISNYEGEYPTVVFSAEEPIFFKDYVVFTNNSGYSLFPRSPLTNNKGDLFLKMTPNTKMISDDSQKES